MRRVSENSYDVLSQTFLPVSPRIESTTEMGKVTDLSIFILCRMILK
jgi:hypothetical protein